MRWINLDTACGLLGVHPQTMRKHESPDGKWCTIQGQTFRVYRVGIHQAPHRRYSETEIMRAVKAIEAARRRQAERKGRPWWAHS